MKRKKHNEKHSKKIRKLVAMCSLIAIILAVSTYAWFIGMKRVEVSEFDINIATTEGLFLSMDGIDWKYNLDVNEATQYDNNTNKLDGVELIPLSSVGDMDSTTSRMKLFEKSSLTAVPGGYRLLSAQVNNYTEQEPNTQAYIEGDGYVAFDLFIKNLSGDEYYIDNDPDNEEAIYLNTNSSVKVADVGGVPNTGIENSLRVAFAQIGRVEGDTVDQDTITGITCADDADGAAPVTGICRSAQIWEPNDTAHVQNAINWYDKSCLARTAADVYSSSSYTESDDGTTTCNDIVNGTAYPTYAISRRIDVADGVNIYDGTAFNTYATNTIDYATYAAALDKAPYKLVEYPNFTDTMKNIAGAERPQFMTLAPNSITKVRVYIYLEGQDIDNYDFAQLGAKVSVNFGFTKERYTEEDIDYDGPSTDITPSDEEENGPDVEEP